MQKIFISQPMFGKTKEEIIAAREDGIQLLETAFGKGAFEVIDSYFDNHPNCDAKNIPLWFLGEAIKKLAEADAALFLEGWESARGCKVEHDCAVEYGIRIFHQV